MISYYKVLVRPCGTRDHRLDGKIHNGSGPAIKHFNGTNHWYINGKRHRENGPATVLSDGFESYWYWGVRCTEYDYYEKYNAANKKNGGS